jgi:hypothetical protein
MVLGGGVKLGVDWRLCSGIERIMSEVGYMRRRMGRIRGKGRRRDG